MGQYLIQAVHILFVSYTVLLFLRIITSWLPNWQMSHFVRFLAFYTDPYLFFFRRLLPPLGGVLDLSPLLAFFALRLLEMVLLRALSFLQ